MSHDNLKELTFRGMFLGALITVIFTASNVYLGLKGGDDFRLLHSSCRNFYGNFKILQGFQYLRKQHGANPSFISGDIVFCYFRSSRSINDGLLARIPILANRAYLCLWRYVGRTIHYSITSCDGGKQRLTLP